MDPSRRNHSYIFGIVESMSKLITPGELAPDFEMEDINGTKIRLSEFRHRKPVVLAFLRGFM
jgi:peroxiredoxin